MPPSGHVDQQDILPYNPNNSNNPNNPNKQLGLKEIGKVSMHCVHVKPEFSDEIGPPSNSGFISQSKEEPHLLEPTKGS